MDRKHLAPTTPLAADQASTAILVVHFGTSYADTRRHTIDATTDLIAHTFAPLICREAWTSRHVIRKLKAQNEIHHTPTEAMQQLLDEGVRQLIVQPTYLLDGVEMESLKKEVDTMKASFDHVRLGSPLLYTIDDFRSVINALNHLYPANACEALVLVGHGTHTAATASYAMLEYMLQDMGHTNVFVGTIEGYPTSDEVLRKVQRMAPHRVCLAPLLFVAGDHAQNDIDGEWRELFEEQGYIVDVQLQGLGEYLSIRNIYLNHIRTFLL